MSNNNNKGKKSNTRESFLENKLRDSNIKHSTGKDIKVISRNYINGNVKNNTESKKISKQITKLHIVDKNNKDNDEKNNKDEEKKIEDNEENKDENEKENIEENLTDRLKENLPGWNETHKLQEKIKQLEEQITLINTEHLKDIQKYKDEIEKKVKEIKQLLHTNNSLKNSLEVLTQRLDKILVNSNQQKLKINKIINNNNEDLQHQLDIKEKELKNQQQLINILTKDNKNIRNMLNTLNNLGIDEKNINFTEKIQQQYQEIQVLKKNLKEYKLKLEQKQASTQKEKKEDVSSKEVNLSTEEDNSNIKKKHNFFLQKNKKIKLNSLSSASSAYNIHKFNKFTNKSQSCETNKNTKKKFNYKGINSSFGNISSINNNEAAAIFTEEEIMNIKNCFYDEQKYENFMNKINILEKATKSKEKEMNMKIKLIENKLKEKENELIELKKQAKEKESKIFILSMQNKELKKNKDELINKINFMAETLNELDQKNQKILQKNEQIRNSIFNIDGIIEAKSKEGKTIPLLKQVKSGSISLEKSPKKNGNDSVNQSSGEEKNSYKYSIISDEIGGAN